MKQNKSRHAMGIKLTGIIINVVIIGSLVAGLTSGFRLVGTGGL